MIDWDSEKNTIDTWWIEDLEMRFSNEAKVFGIDNFNLDLTKADNGKTLINFTGDIKLIDAINIVCKRNDYEFNLYSECIETLKLSRDELIEIEFKFIDGKQNEEMNYSLTIKDACLVNETMQNKVVNLLNHASIVLTKWKSRVLRKWKSEVDSALQENLKYTRH